MADSLSLLKCPKDADDLILRNQTGSQRSLPNRGSIPVAVVGQVAQALAARVNRVDF